MDRCKSITLYLVLLLALRVSCADYYSSYYGTKLTVDDVNTYTKNGTLANCTNAVEKCDASEPRRIDGTCNNLAHPYRGATRTPYIRLLEADYNRTSDSVFDPRVSACTGSALADARDVRCTLLVDGRVDDDKLTISATYYAVFFASDITSNQDTINFVSWRPYCCKPEGANDPQCAPNPVPANDYVHRFTNIICQNMTRPLTFQTSGCLASNTTPLRVTISNRMNSDDKLFYDANGVYLNETFPMVTVNSNSVFLKKEGRMAYVTQGCFRQPSGRVNDHTVDSDVLNFGLGRYQRANDILTNDLAKTRHFGIPSYIHYRSYCFGDNITSFNQLKEIISNERVEALKSKYSYVEDIDLLAGVWMEELMDNAFVPPTFYCIVKEQLLHNIKSDRHWYERADRPNAFSEAELGQIRKITASRMLCDVGDTVTEIQPRAFELPGKGNEIVSCDVIPNIDYAKWADSRCSLSSLPTQAN